MTRARLVIGSALVAGLFLSSAFVEVPPSSPAGCTVREVRPPVPPVRSAEEVRVALEGEVPTRVAIGGRPVPTLPHPGGLSLRLVGGTPNLLEEGGFEEDGDLDGVPDGWRLGSGASRPVLDGGVAHSGRRSIRTTNDRISTSEAFQRDVSVRTDTFYVLSAWMRTERVRPVVPTAIREPTHRHSPVQVQVEQLGPDGSVVGEARTAYGYTDTAEWHRQAVGFRTGPDVRRIRIRGLLSEGSGTAWFDDVSVSELFGTRSVPVDGTGAEPVRGTQLVVRTRSRHERGAVWVDGSVTGSGEDDEAFQVTFTLPIDARGWQWADYARRSRSIVEGRYSYETTSSLQTSSRYPFGAIYDGRFGLGIGVPLSEPRIFRIDYETGRGLSLTFDMAVSPAAASLGPRATFSFVVFGFDPAWGFRAATQRYYELFPDSFVRRTDPRCEGAWFFAPSLFGLPVQDFGLGLNTVALGKASSQRFETWGIRYLPLDDVVGIYASAYGHHWAYFQPAPAGKSGAYDRVMAELRRETRRTGSSDDVPRRRAEAAAALRSTARDQNGRLYYERYGPYVLYYENLDPLPDGPSWTEAVVSEQVERAINVARDEGASLAGIHLDSTSGMRRWGAADDYDRSHWAAATLPLTFSYDSGLVAERGVFPMYGHLSRMSTLAHDRGMFLSANFNADEARTLGFLGADRIDYFGLEQGLVDRATEEVSLDQFAMVKRTMAHQRPISTLDHKIGRGELGDHEIDRRLQQNLFYGMFAGAFNAPVEADGGSGVSTWTAGDAPRVWARYTPIIRRLATAGWEPVTFARSSNPAVWVERFGSLAHGDLVLTLRNETGQDQPFTLTLNLAALGLREPGPISAVELVSGGARRLVVDSAGTGASISATIPRHSTFAVAVRPAP